MKIVIYHKTKNDTITLQKTDNKIFYSIETEKLLEQLTEQNDSLEFNFLIVAGDNRTLPNNGLENIGRRKFYLKNSILLPIECKNITDDILEKEIIYSFDKPYELKLFSEVTFHINISSQIVLGFFEPDEDRVLVCFSSLKPNYECVQMEHDGNNIYTATVPIFYKPNEPITYKFRIVTKRETIIPNNGYENIPARMLYIKDRNTETPYCDFNDLRRVARFIINTKEYEQKKTFEPNKGDVLQIKLLLDGKETLTDALFNVDKYTYETAVVIPMSAREIKWGIVKNIKEEIKPLEEIELGVEGKIVRN